MVAARHAIPELDINGLRRFGISTGIIVGVLFGLFFPWLMEHPIPRWPWILGGTLILWALITPTSLRPVYKAWMRLGMLISQVTTPIILGLVFFVAITPIALIRRLLHKDSMTRGFDKTMSTYRVQSTKAERDNLEKPF